MAACAGCRAAGGLEAERAERNKLKEEAAARDKRNFEWDATSAGRRVQKGDNFSFLHVKSPDRTLA